MQAVIMAAGESTRTYPLTLTRPKPLLTVAGKTIIEHNLDQLVGLVDEVVLVVGYRQEMIRSFFGDSYRGLNITYVEQKERLGTGHVLMTVRDYVSGRFMILNGDDLFAREDMKACLHRSLCVLAAEVGDVTRFGLLVVENGVLKDLTEKSPTAGSGLGNTGLYMFDDRVFDIEIPLSPRGEYEITDFVKALMPSGEMECVQVRGYWLPVGYPWDLLAANEFLLQRMDVDTAIEGTLMEPAWVDGPLVLGEGSVVEPFATIKGPVVIGRNTVVMSHSYIEGPTIIGDDCKIEPRTYIRKYTSLGNRCRVNADIKNCLFMDGSNAAHINSYLGDSIIGSNVNIGSGTTTANLRHDGKNILCRVKGTMVDTGRRKLGTIIADGVHTGIFTMIYPGRMIWPGQSTLPGAIVKEDIC